ncbi:hypothetical protein TNCT_168881, partial [Trichonephila clavata]
IMNPNMMVTCPYNNAHRMKESRLQIHITKCRQDHLDDDHFVCPFNSTHVLPFIKKGLIIYYVVLTKLHWIGN